MNQKTMDILWAPWRMEFIKKKKSRGCFLCEMIKGKNTEFLIWKGKYSIVVMNAYPYNNGHLMIAPIKHTKDINHLSEKEVQEIFSALKECVQILKKVMKPDGFNIGINLGKCAGAGLLGHIHIHIVPRWNGDTNFMPVISATKVIPQSLEQLSIILKKNFSNYKEDR